MPRHTFNYWFGTLNNPGYSPEALWSKITMCGGTWLIGQPEQGAEGTFHFQFVCYFKSEKSLTAVKRVDTRIHWEPSKSESAVEYVQKVQTRAGEPFEFGTKPIRGNNQHQKGPKVSELAQKSVKELGEELTAMQFNAAFKAINVFKCHTQDRFSGPRTCLWIYGEPGVGKSRYAKSFNPYIKAQNKWWDGYNGEPDVLIDDFDELGKCLSHYLKLWGDPYGTLDGEIKGGTIPLNFRRLIVTSNYTIDQLFWNELSPELAAALKRRFLEWEFK